MYFTSTADPTVRVECKRAIVSAFGVNGGLLVPVDIPKISIDELKSLSKLSYVDLLSNVLFRFVGEEFSEQELREMFADIPTKFKCGEEMIPLKEIVTPKGHKVSVAELFHGPSLAFKDLATIPSCRLINRMIGKTDGIQRALLTVATSGDTGASVCGAVENCENLDVMVFLPGHGRVSKIQELQTITWKQDNAHIFVPGLSNILPALPKLFSINCRCNQ